MNIIQALRCQSDLISLSSLLHHLSYRLSSQQEPGSPMGKPLSKPNEGDILDEMMTQQLAMCEGDFIACLSQEPLCP